MIVNGIKQKYSLCLGILSEFINITTMRMPKNKENMTKNIITNQCKLRMSIVEYISFSRNKDIKKQRNQKHKNIYVLPSVE